MRRVTQMLVIWGLTALASESGLANGHRVELGKRYCDPLYGFSLRPPAGAEKIRGASGARLVSWSRRDKQTGRILWTLSVSQALEGNRDIDLQPYSRALAEKLRLEEGFKVGSVDLSPVAGKKAIHFRGRAIGMALWQERVWILARPQEFIIVMLSGPAELRQDLEAVSQEVLATVEFFDPTEARRLRRVNLQQGKEFLASLSEARLSSAMADEERWFLLRMKGRPVGFRRLVCRRAKRKGAEGFEVKLWLMLKLAGLEPRLLKQTMFVTGDLSVEWWRKQLRIGSAPTARMIKTECLKQGDRLVCTVCEGRRIEPHDIPVPVDNYLPQAIGALLPRLIDLAKPGSWAFLDYDADDRMFNLRTVTVAGPGQVSSAGAETSLSSATQPGAVKVLDQPARDVEPATLWIDKAAGLVKMKTADGLVMVRAEEAEVMRLLPEARGAMATMGQ